MKEIKVLGTGCAKCTTLYDNVKNAVAELELTLWWRKSRIL